MGVQTDNELLHDSRVRAKQVLAESAQKAQSLLDDAHREAIRLLLEQQQKAADLLIAEQQEAVRARKDAAATTTESLTARERGEHMHEHDLEASDLVERQRIAAGLPVEAQRQAAELLNASVERASTDVLMAGQKEAAAILLEARMRIEDQRFARQHP